MEQTWRWFGPHDPISLSYVKQAGATGIVTALHHIPVGHVWSREEIADRKAVIERLGLRWSVCESIPVDDAIKRGGGGARPFIDAWKDSLANLGRAGVDVVCYNFMPVVDWTRTDINYPLPNTGFALRFDIFDFVGYDVFVLRRPDAEKDYHADLVAQAHDRIAGMHEEAIERLEHNIISGLPGGAGAHTRASIGERIESFRGAGVEDMRANLTAFLNEVVPVAEEFGVRLAIHPDDPPFTLFGLPRIVSTARDARAILASVDSAANGLTFCTGSYGVRADNDLTAMAREFASRIHFAHLRNVRIESDRCFHEAEHLDGRADMVAIVEILLREERLAAHQGRRRQIPLRPDHGHVLGDDIGKPSNPGYSYTGRLKGLAELRGLIRAIERQISAGAGASAKAGNAGPEASVSRRLHDDRLFPADPATRAIARALYAGVRELPILSPHGHTDPRWFAEDQPFSDPAQLFVTPDHYVFRMLYSQGVPLEELGVPRIDGGPVDVDPRRIWRRFAEHYRLFAGTPTRLWLDHAFESLFGLTERLSAANADRHYDVIADALQRPEFRPRALYERFKIEAIATTDGALDSLGWHEKIASSGWRGRVIPTYRPDAIVDPEYPGFRANIDALSELTGEDATSWRGYLAAHRKRRAFFKSHGATASDHGHPSAATADLTPEDAEAQFARVLAPNPSGADCWRFRAQMLTEMAAMSLDDGLVMQIHPGAFRNHNPLVAHKFGRDKGADIPVQAEYTHALKPLLDRFGNEPALTIILFTLDEATYSRELAPLAGHYPALRLGPPWWFFDSVNGMRRFRERTTETAGFYNTVGFNDDTRAFCSIPARHDVARRVDCAYLASLIASHQIEEAEGHELAHALAYGLAKAAYRL